MTSLFVEQPNLRLKLAAALCKTVLKLGSSQFYKHCSYTAKLTKATSIIAAVVYVYVKQEILQTVTRCLYVYYWRVIFSSVSPNLPFHNFVLSLYTVGRLVPSLAKYMCLLSCHMRQQGGAENAGRENDGPTCRT